MTEGRTVRPADDDLDEARYEVTVWNICEGDVIKRLREATWKQVEVLREQYSDEPCIEVLAEEWP